MNPLEAAALSKMTGYTYVPYEHPEPPTLEPAWQEHPRMKVTWWMDKRDEDQRVND